VVLDKRLPIYHRARRLVELIDRACQVPDVADRFDEQALQWWGDLVEMMADGHVAEERDRFHAAFAPLQTRFKQVYGALHTERDKVLEAARSELKAEGLSTTVLSPYNCSSLCWAPDGLACGECYVTLHELPTHLIAIPSVTQRQIVRERKLRLKGSDAQGRQVTQISLNSVLGGREIADRGERDAALADLKQAIDDALSDGGVVTLV